MPSRRIESDSDSDDDARPPISSAYTALDIKHGLQSLKTWRAAVNELQAIALYKGHIG